MMMMLMMMMTFVMMMMMVMMMMTMMCLTGRMKSQTVAVILLVVTVVASKPFPFPFPFHLLFGATTPESQISSGQRRRELNQVFSLSTTHASSIIKFYFRHSLFPLRRFVENSVLPFGDLFHD